MEERSQVEILRKRIFPAEPPTGVGKVMGSTPVGGSEHSFSESFCERSSFNMTKIHSKDEKYEQWKLSMKPRS